VNFQREEGTRPQTWIDDNLPICPLCRNDPSWTTATEVDQQATERWFFKCSSCASVLSTTPEAARKVVSRLARRDTTMDLPTGKNVRVESAGRQEDQDFVGEEFPLYELQEWADED